MGISWIFPGKNTPKMNETNSKFTPDKLVVGRSNFPFGKAELSDTQCMVYIYMFTDIYPESMGPLRPF